MIYTTLFFTKNEIMSAGKNTQPMARLCTLAFVILAISTSSSAQSSTPIDQILKTHDIIQVNTGQLYEQITASATDATIPLTIADYNIHLHRAPTLAPSYKAVDHLGNTIDNPGRAIPLRGHTRDGRPVTATIGKNYLMASIGVGNDQIWIEKGSSLDPSLGSDQYVLYLASAVISDPHARCGVTKKTKQTEKYNSDLQRSAMMGTCYDVEYAMAHDFSMTTQLGTAADVENFGIAITNEMNTLYSGQFADILNFQITGQFVSPSTGADPWTTSLNAGTLLNSFTSWAPSNFGFPHDDGTLWTNRNLAGSTIGLAWLGTVCTSNKYNICEHQVSIVVNRRLVGHEVGHNFGLDHVSGSFVMAGVVNNASDTWSPFNISEIENYYNGLPNSCLDSPCQLGTPSISWLTATSTFDELSTLPNSAGNCGVAYEDRVIVLDRSNFSASTIGVAISVNAASTAEVGDYELLTPAVTFVSGGALTEAVMVRIYDDAIQEGDETIQLDFAITSGTATVGGIPSHTLTINDSGDEVSSNCCSGGALTTIGSATNFDGRFLAGNNSSFRSRYFIPASTLLSAGVIAGPISQLDLNVWIKNSTSAFEDLTISLANHSGSTLPSTWITTTAVFSDDYNTTLGWNAFPFTTPFTWNGTAGLYVELCYSGASPGGVDALLGAPVADFNSGYVTSFSPPLCTGDIFGNALHNITPQTRITSSGGAKIETSTTTTYSSPIASGETIHIYSDDDEVIASLTNTGSTDIGCVDMAVHTAGNGKSSLTGTIDEYSDKTIKIDTDVDADYSVTLYYKDTELTTWGANAGSLQVLQSSVPLVSATASTVVTAATTVTAFDGSDTGSGYTATFTGDGYFTITDRAGQAPAAFDGSIFVAGSGNGILMTSSSGNRYLVYEGSPNNLVVTTAPSVLAAASVGGSDVYISGSGGLFLRALSGGSYSEYGVTNAGVLTYTPATIPGPPVVRLLSGDLEVSGAGNGLVMSSANGACFKISVVDDNGGSLDVSAVSCP